MNRSITNRLVIALGALLLGSSLQAAILDQSYTPGPGTGGYNFGVTNPLAQTFKAGLTGQVDSVEVQVLNYFGAATAPLDLELWTISNPTSSPATLVSMLASGSISQTLVPSTSGFVHFNLLSSGASFTAGQDYAIVLRTTSNFTYLFEGPTNGTYANGSGRDVSGSGLYYTLAGPNLDFGFKTFVAVPEPSNYLAGAAILVGGLYFVRRQKKFLTQTIG